MGQCQFCQLVSCDRRMLVVFHGEFALALSHGPQPSAVAKHLSQRNMSFHNDLISLCFAILYQAFSSVDITNNRSLKFVWYPYLQEARRRIADSTQQTFESVGLMLPICCHLSSH